MTTVQEIKNRNTEREWADIEALVRAISPTLEKNAERRRDEEVRKAREARRKAREARRKAREARRKANINAALHNAGIPLRLV